MTIVFAFLEATVADFMTTDVRAASRTMTLADLERSFERDDFNTYPVVEGGDVVGVVSKFDFLKCFAFTTFSLVPRYDDLMNQTVGEVMTSEYVYVAPATKLTRVLQLMVEHRLRSMPVIAPDGRLAGMISREDVMRALRIATTTT
jgi:CBS domain-containing protein